MRRHTQWVPPLVWTAPVLAVLLMVLSGLTPASANGGTKPVVKNARVGPYEMQVGIFPGNPKVGNLHLSILVNDAEAGESITDATIMVMAAGPAGTAVAGPVQATNTPQAPQFYDADIELTVEGDWTLTLETDSRLGKASLEIPLRVTPPPGFNLVYLLAGAVVVIALALWAWGPISARWKRRGAQNQGRTK